MHSRKEASPPHINHRIHPFRSGRPMYRTKSPEWRQPTAFLGVCFNCQDVGHRAAECPRTVCFTCHQPGHRASMCPSRQPQESRDRCQVCDKPGYVFKNCPSCRQFRESMGNGAAGAQSSPLPPPPAIRDSSSRNRRKAANSTATEKRRERRRRTEWRTTDSNRRERRAKMGSDRRGTKGENPPGNTDFSCRSMQT